jgi:diguanylate cyclase (GGDEF)-like protein
MGLDPRSIILLAGLLAILMAVVLMSLQRSYPASILGLREWSAAPLACFAATMLFGARGLIPDFPSVVLGNVTLLVGSLLFLAGTQRFHGIAPAWKTWGAVIAVSALLFSWYLVKEPRYDMRVVIITIVMTAIFGLHSWVLVKHGAKSFAVRFTAGVCIVQSVVLVLRMVTTLLDPRSGTMFDATPMQTAYVATYAVSILLVTIGLILMATDRLRSELEHLASHDALTGVLNRRAILQICAEELERSQRYGHPMSLMMMDLDNFKAVNDTHGHQAGDRLLAAFARSSSALLRKPDRLGRYGGEEFIVALPETSLEDARIVAQRFLDAMPASAPEPRCTVSIGIAAASGSNETLDSLLARADAALYRAKELGRNRIELG